MPWQSQYVVADHQKAGAGKLVRYVLGLAGEHLQLLGVPDPMP